MRRAGTKRRLWLRCKKHSRWDSRDFAVLDSSPYFSALRTDPRFQQLVQRYRK
jgi:hypothetical protein